MANYTKMSFVVDEDYEMEISDLLLENKINHSYRNFKTGTGWGTTFTCHIENGRQISIVNQIKDKFKGV